jgi:Leucine-rich repeat (LRR) protein
MAEPLQPPNGGLLSGIMRGTRANLVDAVGAIRNAPVPVPARVVAAQQHQHPNTGILNTPQKLQAYLNSLPPGLTEIALNHRQLSSLHGVQFPPSLSELELLEFYDNEITSLAGLQFPIGLQQLNLGKNKITTLAGVRFPPGLTELDLTDNKITSLSGVIFPPGLTELRLSSNQITSLSGVQFPIGLTVLELHDNKITSLAGVQFPSTIKDELSLSYNQITSLHGVVFPSDLETLHLNNNKIVSLRGVKFPNGLLELDLSNNKITSLDGLQIPPDSTIELKGNPLYSLTGITNPDEHLIDYLKHNFPSLYFRDLHYQRKDAKMAEKSALKAARQSQKATIKEMSDLSQQSMHNQLKAVTSFLREDMEARARQHADQPITGSSTLFVRVNGKPYPVPLNVTMTVQSVLDYMNEHYYISVLVPNCSVMKLVKERRVMDPARALADYNVLNEETLHAMCVMPVQNGGKRTKRIKRTIKPRNKRSNKSKTKSKKNGHKRK